MNFPKIHLNRDSVGRFMPKSTKIASLVYMGLALVVVAYVISEGLVAINEWSKLHGIQKPLVVLTNQGDELLKVVKRPVVYDRKPIEVLSPFSRAVVNEQPIIKSELNEIELIILDVFGIEDYKIARAVFKAESGLKEGAFHANDNGSIDVGVGQINSIHFNREGCSFKELVDARKNIECAKQIYDEQGWSPWVVFQTGAFRGNL